MSTGTVRVVRKLQRIGDHYCVTCNSLCAVLRLYVRCVLWF